MRVVKDNPLEKKAKAFALRIVKAYAYLHDRKSETVMSKQLLRSGTSIGANVAEAQFALSRADFAAKMAIALKEASETMFWLDLLASAGVLQPNKSSNSLIADCDELISMLVPTVKKAKI